MMISFEIEQNRFQVRAACIILHNGKILLQRLLENERWFLPGGRVELFESAETTIEREMMEEYAVPIVDKKLVWFVEHFTKTLHEIGLFFLVTLPENHAIYSHDAEFMGEESFCINKWVRLDQLGDYTVIPGFVVPELNLLDAGQGVKYIVHRDAATLVI